MATLDDSMHVTNPSIYSQNESQSQRFIMTNRLPTVILEETNKAWTKNKIRRGEMFYYRCTAHQKNGSPCPNSCLQEPPYCKRHSKASPDDKPYVRSVSSPS